MTEGTEDKDGSKNYKSPPNEDGNPITVEWKSGGKTVRLLIQPDGNAETRRVVKRNVFVEWVEGIQEIVKALEKILASSQDPPGPIGEIKNLNDKLKKIENEMKGYLSGTKAGQSESAASENN
jgi:hypothetical protein